MNFFRSLFTTTALCAACCGVLGPGCVTTRQVDDRSPDPRDDLPELSAAERQKLQLERRQKLASTRPLATVLDLSPRDPIVNLRVVFRAGSADDEPGKEGTAALAARLMRQATQNLSTTELANALFPWAAEIDTQVDKETIVFTGRVHQDHAAAFAQLFLDVILHPRLDPGDFDRLRAEHKAYLERTLRTGNDEALQREALEVMLYDRGGRKEGHRYRHTPMGTVQGLQRMQLDDVKAFVASHLTRDAAVLGISGGASPAFVDQLTAGLESLPFSEEHDDEPPRSAASAPALPGRNEALLIDKPAAGSAISLGFVLPELSRTHPDYAAMKLAETWFGEHRNLIGHLFDSMREKRGLNYGDYAYVEHFRQEGWSTYEQLNIPRRTQYFSMWIRPVEHKNRLFALRQAVWELDKFAKNGIPDDESFRRVQSFVQGYWRAKEQEPMRRLGYLVDRALTSMPYDRDELRARVRTLTRAEVNAAVARHIHADRLSIVVVTQDAKQLAAEIAAGTSSPITYAAKVPEGQLAEDRVIERFDLGLTPDAVRVVSPDSLFEE